MAEQADLQTALAAWRLIAEAARRLLDAGDLHAVRALNHILAVLACTEELRDMHQCCWCCILTKPEITVRLDHWCSQLNLFGSALFADRSSRGCVVGTWGGPRRPAGHTTAGCRAAVAGCQRALR